MKHGFEIASLLGGLGLIAAGNLLVVEVLPFAVPIFNMMGILIIVLPPAMALYARYRDRRDMEEQFVSFIMDLAESVDSGMSLPLALEHCARRDYIALSRHVKKLASQVNWGVPFRRAFESFAAKTRSPAIRRAVATVIQTYRMGGKVSETLRAVNKSMITINKLNAERRASVYSQVVTSYLIFFVFIFIMLIMQMVLLPTLTPEGMEDLSLIGAEASPQDFTLIFSAFIIIQGFFAGLATGKMSEGSIPAGLKHSLLLSGSGYIIFALATQLPQIRLF